MPLKRDESFVPLSPAALAADSRGDYRVTVMSQAENAQPFRPLGHSGGASIQLPGDVSHEPRVSVQREGDRVTAIQIQCTCGQLIELACAYETAPVAKPAPAMAPMPAPPAPLPPEMNLPAAPPPPAPAASVAPPPAVVPPVEPQPSSEPAAAAKAPAKKPKAKVR